MNTAALQLLIQLKDEATQGIQNIGGALTKMGGLAVAGIGIAGTALVGFGAKAVSVAGDFEAGVNRFSSVTGGALAQAGVSIDQFKAQWLQLGAETQFSAAEAQDAAINLAKGGVAIKDILGGATSAVLDLAAAGELELGPAAEIVAKQLGVWSDTGTTAAEVANLMAQAANASTVDVDELALGLANVGGVAKGAGVGFKDLTTTMALIAPGFSSAADAGTSLKTLITRLVPSTGDAKAAFAEIGLSTMNWQKALEYLKARGITPASDSARDIGISLDAYAKKMKMSKKDTQDFFLSFEENNFFDAKGQFLGMANAADQLKTAMGDMSDIEKTEFLKKIFGDDGARAAIALIEAGGEGLNKMAADMSAAGTAAEQAKVKQQGFNFAMDSLKGSIETISIVAGGLLLPILTNLINTALIPGANAVLEFFTSLSTGQGSAAPVIATFQGIGAAVSSFISYLQLVVEEGDYLNDFLANLPAGVQPIAQAIGEMIVVFTNLGGYIQGVVEDGDYLNDFLANMPASAQPLVAAFGQVVAALNTFGQYMQVVIEDGDYLNDFLGSLPASVQPLALAFGQAFTGIKDAVQTVFDYITAGFAEDGIIGAISSGIAGIVAVITGSESAATAVGTAYFTAFTTIQTAIGNAVSYVVANLPTIVATVQTVFSTVQGIIQGVVGYVVANLPTIQATFNTVMTALSIVINNIAIPTLQWFLGLFTEIVTWVQTNWPLIQATVTPVIQAIVSIAQVALPIFAGLFYTAFEGIKLAIGIALDLILGSLRIAMQTMQGDSAGAMKTLEDMFASIWGRIKNTVTTFMNTIKAVVGDRMNDVKNDIKNKLNEAVTWVEGVAARFIDAGRNMVTGLWSGIQGMGGWFKEKFQGWLREHLPDWAAKILGIASPSKVAALEIGRPFIQGIAAGIERELPGLRAMVQSVTRDMLEAADDISASVLGAMAGNAIGGGVGALLGDSVGDFLDSIGNQLGNVSGAIGGGGGTGAVGGIVIPGGGGNTGGSGLGRDVGGDRGRSTITINQYNTVSNEVDVNQMAYALAKKIQTRRGRR